MAETANTSLMDYLTTSLTVSTTTTIFLVMALTAITAYYFFYPRSKNDTWVRLGVKCPKLSPTFFFGSDFRSQITELFERYGDIVGVEDRNVLLFTCNLDLLRHILIKDFNNFVDRGDPLVSTSPFAKSLFFAAASDWRRHRQITSPTFTSGKLKLISKLVEKSAKDLVAYLEQSAKNGGVVDIKDLTSRYTCEIIAKTAFGLNAKFIGGGEAQFLNYARSFLPLSVRKGIWRLIFVLLVRIPKLSKFCTFWLRMQYFDPVDHEADKYFGVTLKSTIADRRQRIAKGEERVFVDFLDLLLKASEAAGAGRLPAAGEDSGSQGEKSVRPLTDEEMIGHAELVIFAGMETTATTLQMCLYELARHPDIQEKVYKEIEAVVKSESPTAEELNSLTFTEQVLNETLRLYPPVVSVNRKAKETRTYNGITIPAGAFIVIPYFYILKDPRNFPNPEKFDPSRFSPEQKDKWDSMAFAAFGHGPRLCLGMRLAYLELKQGLVHILRRLKVVLNEKTEPKAGSPGVEFTVRSLLTPVKPIMLAFELRDTETAQ